MNTSKKVEQTLRELRRATGLPLELTLGDNADLEKIQQQLSDLCNTYKEATRQDVVLRRYLLGGVSKDDFLSYATRMHMDPEVTRALFLIQLNNETCTEAISILKSVYSDTASTVFSLRQNQIVVIRQIHNRKKFAIKEIAFEFLNILNTELMIQADIAYGPLVQQLQQLSDSFHEAELALQIGTIFYPDRNVYGYNELDVGTIIYDLPQESCRKYICYNLGEQFLRNGSIFFEPEILETAECFLRCNLNIAETARQLHVHRNTLLYRLEQIQNDTGLDIRKFSSAMTFKLCSQILLYLRQSNP